ncbi:hypothetical protein FBU30_006117 [Linnemannia zychae]|nr:hypothetical protein FBU30_006117 [Linnemannia zychae]
MDKDHGDSDWVMYVPVEEVTGSTMPIFSGLRRWKREPKPVREERVRLLAVQAEGGEQGSIEITCEKKESPFTDKEVEELMKKKEDTALGIESAMESSTGQE